MAVRHGKFLWLTWTSIIVFTFEFSNTLDYWKYLLLLQEIGRLQRVHGPSAISAKDEMARLSRHLGSLPLLAKHRINCIRTAIKRNMEVQNYAYSKQMLELLLSKAPSNKQEEFRSLVDLCVQRGLTNKSIDPLEDPSQFCSATLSRLSTIGYDVCDLCGAKFSAVTAPGCIVCGMGSIKRSDAIAASVPSPFGWASKMYNNTCCNVCHLVKLL